jgi:hypothetical protein
MIPEEFKQYIADRFNKSNINEEIDNLSTADKALNKLKELNIIASDILKEAEKRYVNKTS